MFTGLIEALGRITALRPSGGGLELEVACAELCGDLAVGDSVAVAGVCQTVTALAGDRFRFFAMGETLRATTLGEFRSGNAVNLERALTPTSRLGGHFVTGHVDGVGEIAAIREEGEWRALRLSMAEELAEMLVPKGSVAVDGISLTAGGEIQPDSCEVYIIPHTLAATTLGAARVGDRVNLETDLLGKYVLRYMTRGENKDRRLLDLLFEQGFMKGEDS